MKPLFTLICLADMEAEKKNALELELDYMLASLWDAMVSGDHAEKDKCIARLTQIRTELSFISPGEYEQAAWNNDF